MIIIAGITRSGLTVTMQMLFHGGHEVVGEYPAFEPHPVGKIPWDTYFESDKAIKLLDSNIQLPPDGDYSIIRLKRNLKEQAKSFNKFLQQIVGQPPVEIKGLIKSFKSDYLEIDEWVKKHKNLYISFEEIINSPMKVSKKISNFCSKDLDIKAMAECVVKRSPKCFPIMLEERFI